MSYQGFYYSIAKPVEEMSREELIQEIESAEQWFADCAAIGQGINSKETIRHRRCRERLGQLDEFKPIVFVVVR
jgi:hypothetical protein